MIRRTELKRSPLSARRTPVKQRRAGKRRVSVLRDPDYLDFIRDRQCIACREERRTAIDWNRLPRPFSARVEAAHTKVNGTGSKGTDSSCLPLCTEHHREQHRIGAKDFALYYGLNLAQEAAAHWAVYEVSKAFA